MEPVGAIASVITLVALAKEISAIANDLMRSFRNAPKEVVQSCNQISLIFLELSCIDQMQQEGTLESLLTADELRNLMQSLVRYRNPNRALILTTSRRISIKAQKENADHAAHILQELRIQRNGVVPGSSLSSRSQATVTATDIELTTAFRHRYTLALTEYWKHLLGSDMILTTSQNDFQLAYEFYARIPIFTFSGRMAFMLSLSLRRMSGLWRNVSVLGGGLNIVNIVPIKSEIVNACRRRDRVVVQNLFLERKAAPNDMSTEDKTLLYVLVTATTRVKRY
jgi:hypothetical protein